MMRGIPVEKMQYAGGAFVWLRPFPLLTGIGLVLGYALLGAGWLAAYGQPVHGLAHLPADEGKHRLKVSR